MVYVIIAVHPCKENTCYLVIRNVQTHTVKMPEVMENLYWLRGLPIIMLALVVPLFLLDQIKDYFEQ